MSKKERVEPHAWLPRNWEKARERDNVTMQNEKQIIISSFKAAISAILYEPMENCTLSNLSIWLRGLSMCD